VTAIDLRPNRASPWDVVVNAGPCLVGRAAVAGLVMAASAAASVADGYALGAAADVGAAARGPLRDARASPRCEPRTTRPRSSPDGRALTRVFPRAGGLSATGVVVMLRVWEQEAFNLLEQLGSELDLPTQPQTAGFVPVSVDRDSYEDAEADMVRALEQSGVDWTRHVELR
jgi:hypothetical protein